MQIKRIDKRTIAVHDENGSELGRLVRPSIWKVHRELIIPGEGLYHLRAKGLLRKDQVMVLPTPDGLDIPMLELRFNWRGHVHIAEPGRKDPRYVLRRPSFWKQRFVLSNAHCSAMATLRVHQRLFSPMEFSVEEWGTERPDAKLLLLTVHGATVSLERATAAAAA
jgi:hypothetical protein